MRPNGSIFIVNVFLAVISMAFLNTSAGAGTLADGSLTDSCSGPVAPISFQSTEWTIPHATSCYSIYFDEPTAWFVRAGADLAAGGVFLELPACSRDAGLRILDRQLDSLLLEVREAGWRSICFGQIDRAGEPTPVKLVSKALGLVHKNDFDETDPDPDPLMGGGCGRTYYAEKNDFDETDPDPDPLMGGGCGRTYYAEKNDIDETDPDPDPLMGGGCGRTFYAEKNDIDETDPDPDPLMGGGCGRTYYAEKNDFDETDPDLDPLMGGGCGRTYYAEKNDIDETDPDLDPLMGGGCGRTYYAEKNDVDETDPDPDPLMGGGCGRTYYAEKNDIDETDPDPDPLMGSGCGDRLSLAMACDVAGAWGAEQIPACSTLWLEQQWTVAGEGRMLRLTVADWQKLEIEVDGRVELALHDASGQRIAYRKLAGQAGQEAFGLNLAPGHYWLEVTGDALRYNASAF